MSFNRKEPLTSLPWMYEELPHFHSRTRKTPLPRSESVEKSSQEDGGASIDHEVLDQLESLEPMNQCLRAIADLCCQKKLQHIKYQKQKLKKIQAAVIKRMLQATQSIGMMRVKSSGN